MKTSEIRELPTEEIIKELKETQRALFNLRFQKETERLEKPAEMKKAKTLVARLKTILRQRQAEEGLQALSSQRIRAAR